MYKAIADACVRIAWMKGHRSSVTVIERVKPTENQLPLLYCQAVARLAAGTREPEGSSASTALRSYY